MRILHVVYHNIVYSYLVYRGWQVGVCNNINWSSNGSGIVSSFCSFSVPSSFFVRSECLMFLDFLDAINITLPTCNNVAWVIIVYRIASNFAFDKCLLRLFIESVLNMDTLLWLLDKFISRLYLNHILHCKCIREQCYVASRQSWTCCWISSVK